MLDKVINETTVNVFQLSGSWFRFYLFLMSLIEDPSRFIHVLMLTVQQHDQSGDAHNRQRDQLGDTSVVDAIHATGSGSASSWPSARLTPVSFLLCFPARRGRMRR